MYSFVIVIYFSIFFYKGISGRTTKLDQFVWLNFQIKFFKNNKFYFQDFKEKFLNSNCIPTDLLFGNQFIRKFKIHYNYKDNTLYSYLNYNSLNNHKIKSIKNKGNNFYLNSLKRKIFKNKFFKGKIKNKFYYKNFSKNRSKNFSNFSKNPKFNKYKNSSNKNSKIYVYVKYLNKSKSKFSSKKFNKNHQDLNNNKKEYSYNFLIYWFLSMKERKIKLKLKMRTQK